MYHGYMKRKTVRKVSERIRLVRASVKGSRRMLIGMARRRLWGESMGSFNTARYCRLCADLMIVESWWNMGGFFEDIFDW